MKNKNDIFEKMSEKEIFNELLPSFTRIYNSVIYLEIPKNSFLKLAISEIKNAKKNYNTSKPYDEYIKNRLKNRIIKMERNLLESDSNEVDRIVNNYINYNFKNIESFDQSLILFKKFESFLSLYNCDLNLDQIITLLNNKKFNNIIQIIVNRFLPNLSIKNVRKVYASYLLSTIIETYAMVNNIQLIDDEQNTINQEENNVYQNDNEKIYLREISNKRVLTYYEEKEFIKRIRNGDKDAKQEFIECYLKLVVYLAKKYHNNVLSLSDLIQEGNVGLLIALEKFNPDLGCKFSTYAVYWIKQAISRAIMNKGRIVRLPVYLYEGLSSYLEKVDILSNELKREPTVDEIVERFNISKNQALKYYEALLETKSLNETILDDNSKEFGEKFLLSDDNVEEDVFKKQMQEDVKKVFDDSFLSSKEIEIIKLRFGFYDGKVMTLQAIADKYGVTRERIRQIEARALNKIRDSKILDLLAEYTSNPDKNRFNRTKVYKYRNDIFKKALKND